MAQKNFPDIQEQHGDAKVTWDSRGFRAYRKFKVNGADMTTPTSTLYSIITANTENPDNPLSDIPARMTPHPTIRIPSAWGAYYDGIDIFAVNNSFCADVISCDAISSTQAMINVEYAILNGMTQEPSANGDGAPGLLEMGSSVQTIKTAQDAFANALIVPYTNSSADPGNYVIYPRGSVDDAYKNTSPSIKITSNVQVPIGSFRFRRRETVAFQASDSYQAFLNSANWIINGVTYPERTILCSRIESTTDDNGFSYIVTYEFLYSQYIDIPPGSNFPSGIPVGSDQASAWDLVAYYAIPAGIGYYAAGPNTIGQNTMPPDAVPSVFSMYQSVDFNDLGLV